MPSIPLTTVLHSRSSVLVQYTGLLMKSSEVTCTMLKTAGTHDTRHLLVQTDRFEGLRRYIESALEYATRTEFVKRPRRIDFKMYLHGRYMMKENKAIAGIIRVRHATNTPSLVLNWCP